MKQIVETILFYKGKKFEIVHLEKLVRYQKFFSAI